MTLVTSPTGLLAPGCRLGRYEILSELATGGMAELYVARRVAGHGVEKLVVLKRILGHLCRDESFVRMFLNEARLASKLDHSNIVQVFDFGEVDGVYFMVLEYVHGASVHSLLRNGSRSGPLPLAASLTIVREVAQGLHYAHERRAPSGDPLSLVHRDVSPSNILVSEQGEVKLADFGIATASTSTRATATGTIKGKVAYMPPEQALGEPIDRRADVYALGVILYELTVGQRCFHAPGEYALVNRVVHGTFSRPRRIRRDYPADLEAIVLRALASDRSQRYSTASELLDDLEEFAAVRSLRLSSGCVAEMYAALLGHRPYPRAHGDGTSKERPTPPARSTSAEAVAPRWLRRTTPWAIAGAAGLILGALVSASLRQPVSDSAANAGPALPGSSPNSRPSEAADVPEQPTPMITSPDDTAEVAGGPPPVRPPPAARPDEPEPSAAKPSPLKPQASARPRRSKTRKSPPRSDAKNSPQPFWRNDPAFVPPSRRQ